MGVTFKVQSPVSTGLFYAHLGLKNDIKTFPPVLRNELSSYPLSKNK
jgi:hypothetical protein